MAGMNNGGSESDFVIGGCGYEDCDACPQILCAEDLLGRGVKLNKMAAGLGKEIKEALVSDKGDSL